MKMLHVIEMHISCCCQSTLAVQEAAEPTEAAHTGIHSHKAGWYRRYTGMVEEPACYMHSPVEQNMVAAYMYSSSWVQHVWEDKQGNAMREVRGFSIKPVSHTEPTSASRLPQAGSTQSPMETIGRRVACPW